MKKQFNPIVFIVSLMLFILVCSLFSGCGLVTYTDTSVYSPTYENASYKEFKSEQKQQQENLYNYTQSAEYKKKYSGTSENNKVDSPAAKSIVGTQYDSFKDVRNANTKPITKPTQDIRLIIK
jgi:uncharacterized protein YceK